MPLHLLLFPVQLYWWRHANLRCSLHYTEHSALQSERTCITVRANLHCDDITSQHVTETATRCYSTMIAWVNLNYSQENPTTLRTPCDTVRRIVTLSQKHQKHRKMCLQRIRCLQIQKKMSSPRVSSPLIVFLFLSSSSASPRFYLWVSQIACLYLWQSNCLLILSMTSRFHMKTLLTVSDIKIPYEEKNTFLQT